MYFKYKQHNTSMHNTIHQHHIKLNIAFLCLNELSVTVTVTVTCLKPHKLHSADLPPGMAAT